MQLFSELTAGSDKPGIPLAFAIKKGESTTRPSKYKFRISYLNDRAIFCASDIRA